MSPCEDLYETEIGTQHPVPGLLNTWQVTSVHVILAWGHANIRIVALLVYLLSSLSAFPSPLLIGKYVLRTQPQPKPQQGCLMVGQDHRADYGCISDYSFFVF